MDKKGKGAKRKEAPRKEPPRRIPYYIRNALEVLSTFRVGKIQHHATIMPEMLSHSRESKKQAL